MSSLILVCDDRMLAHHPTGWDPDHPEWTQAVQELLAEIYPDKSPEDWSHPERPERLSAVQDYLAAALHDGVHWSNCDPAPKDALTAVHAEKHVDFIESLDGRSCWLSVDTTAVSPGSVTAAKVAAGAGIKALDAIANGGAKRGFCLIRPPGHHALPDRAMGFCLFNNVAVAARYAQRALGWKRVLVFDWDLHHGNGTQEIFYRDGSVLFADVHCAAPFYPGTGLLEERGEAEGEGCNLNVPIPAGSGNTAFLEAFGQVVAPAARRFQPDLILVSAGFDAHHLDTTMTVNEDGFGALCARVCELADELCQGRVVLMLEGGYHTESLTVCSHACARALAGEKEFAVEFDETDVGLEAVREAARYHDNGDSG